MGWYKVTGGRIVTRYWPMVIGAWIVLAILLRLVAPQWESIAADGDLAYLPSSVPSAVGQRQLDAAFPGTRTRSEMVIVLAKQDETLSGGDLALGLDLARRLHWFAASSHWERLPLKKDDWRDSELDESDRSRIEAVFDNLTQCIAMDEELAKYLESGDPDYVCPRLRDAYEMRAHIFERKQQAEQAKLDRDVASLISEQQVAVLTVRYPAWSSNLQDVWTWRDEVVGHKLGSKNNKARLISCHLETEFTAVANIAVLEGVERLIADMRQQYASLCTDSLLIEVSGSAAVGADMLRAAAGSVKQTEAVTILLVIIILTLVYRGPFLVAIPLTSIGLSLMVATSLVALLARDPQVPSSSGLGVFTNNSHLYCGVVVWCGNRFLFVLFVALS